jgi:hypothetical protein
MGFMYTPILPAQSSPPSQPLPLWKKVVVSLLVIVAIVLIVLSYIFIPSDVKLPFRPVYHYHPYEATENIPPPPLFPPYIHMTLKDKYNPSAEVARNVQSWKKFNPEYSVILYDDDDMRQMVVTYRPDLLFTYDRLDHPVEKADFWRYLVVWVFGGLYVDSDVECVQSIRYWNDMFIHPPNSTVADRWNQTMLNHTTHNHTSNDSVEEDKTLLYEKWLPKVWVGIEDNFDTDEEVQEHRFTAKVQFLQWAFAAVRRHPLFDNILKNIKTFVAEEKLGLRKSTGDEKMDILFRTGPGVFTRTITEWLSRNNVTPQQVLYGYPVVDGVGILEESGFSWKGDLNKSDPRRVSIVHHFKGSWKKDSQ